MEDRRQGGFSLLEVLIALAILAVMMSVAWSSLSSAVDTKVHFEKYQERNREIREAMERIVYDLSHAYISSNETPRGDRYRTYFSGKRASPVDELQFTYMGHQVLWANANESEQARVHYMAYDNEEDRSKQDLVRWESRRLSYERWKDQPGEALVLLTDIKFVAFYYWDWTQQQWRDNWNSMQGDGQRGRLPTMVRIEIVTTDDLVGDTKYTTVARLMLEEQLRFFAQ